MTTGSHRPRHVVQISFFSDPAGRAPTELLEAWPTLVDIAEAARRSGIRVSVVQASIHTDRISRCGVDYHFLPFGEARRVARDNGVLTELLLDLAPDVFHVHGLGFPRDVLALASRVPQKPIILQDHANRPPRFWRRPLWRRAMSVAAGITFCALEQARPFTRAGLVQSGTRLYEIPESTSRFAPGDRAEARRRTGLHGAPAILWVGHLNANKDPLTVLDGVSAAAPELPRLQLFCCFGRAPLMREVQSRIARDRNLRGRVHLLGQVPHENIQRLMQAADLFVLGSHREGSGYSLIEALACGLPPLVTDIPSFRSLTGGGAVGSLWPCGDSDALRRRLLEARIDAETRAKVREHFDLKLSFDSVGLKLAAMYDEVLERPRRAAA